MNNENLGTCAARDPQVDQQIKRLESAVDGIEAALSQLEERVKSVAHQQENTPKPLPPQENLVPMANILRQKNDALFEIKDHIHSLIQRIELS